MIRIPTFHNSTPDSLNPLRLVRIHSSHVAFNLSRNTVMIDLFLLYPVWNSGFRSFLMAYLWFRLCERAFQVPLYCVFSQGSPAASDPECLDECFRWYVTSWKKQVRNNNYGELWRVDVDWNTTILNLKIEHSGSLAAGFPWEKTQYEWTWKYSFA